MNSYSIIGIVLAVIAGGCLVVFGYIVKSTQKKTGYEIPRGKIAFGSDFYTDLSDMYFVTEDFRCALDSMLVRYKEGGIKKRLQAAQAYLSKSRYKDIETALECYLKEDSHDYLETYWKIVQNEEMKCRRLPG
ncbi:hypothetical protein M2454_000770 [Aequitasia blattaphilus]|uniref:Uncharacterized protein n=1 Tax=Aequitasia blattaphilus TaxID=2949332 RepID=A0ABT1EBU0_9FIRM|nr:hypothetical protein [Aequitasia blattaphilus]MCP1101977.1 hypothetical protein [Aequitasia blattaphilus]MCR8614617.1 hypothetical protein [Aequitasia blattaphilus]